MTKRAVIYARVSTEEQKEHGYGLVRQEQECLKYAEHHGIDIVDIIKDDCSGTSLDRPGLSELRQRLVRELIDTVIVHDIDRLSRDVTDFLILRREWMQEQNIEIHYAVSGPDTDDFNGLLMSGVKGMIKQGENDQRRKYTMKGRDNKAEDGKPVLMGIVPYGYDKIGHGREAYLVIDEPKALVIKNIFNWYVHGNGSDKPMSLRKITVELIRREVPPPSYKNRKAKTWYPGSICKILSNETYIGKMYYGKVRTKKLKGSRINQPKEKWIEIPVPELQIVDEQLFRAAENRTKINIRRSKRNRKNQYLLSGHIRCGDCGLAAHGKTERRRSPERKYYRCSSSVTIHNDCIAKSMTLPANEVENFVWDWLVSLLTDEKALEDGLRHLVEQRERELDYKLHELDNIEKVIQVSDARISRLVIEMSYHDPGIVLDTLRDEVKVLGNQREEYKLEQKRLDSEIKQVEISEKTQEMIKSMAATVRDKLPEADFNQKRLLLDKLDVEIIFYREDEIMRAVVECAIPIERKIETCISRNMILGQMEAPFLEI